MKSNEDGPYGTQTTADPWPSRCHADSSVLAETIGCKFNGLLKVLPLNCIAVQPLPSGAVHICAAKQCCAAYSQRCCTSIYCPNSVVPMAYSQWCPTSMCCPSSVVRPIPSGAVHLCAAQAVLRPIPRGAVHICSAQQCCTALERAGSLVVNGLHMPPCAEQVRPIAASMNRPRTMAGVPGGGLCQEAMHGCE